MNEEIIFEKAIVTNDLKTFKCLDIQNNITNNCASGNKIKKYLDSNTAHNK